MPASTKIKSNNLSSAKSDPSLHEARKDRKVHFADTLGLSLVSVYVFRDPTPRSRYRYRNIGIKTSFLERERIDRARLLNFIQPLYGKKLIQTLDLQNVCLENITIRDYSILGNVKVRNLAYEKRVFVRYSMDCWTTSKDIPAHYVYGTSTGSTDTFSFQLIMPYDVVKDFKLEFAICYEVLGVQIWDNNYGDNYRIMWYASHQMLKSRDILDIFQSSKYDGFWI